jgi:hypothetical protein
VGAAQSVEVPVRLQAELLAKVAAYDRAFATRAGGRALVLVVVRPGDPVSERVGEQILGELGVLPEIGGVAHADELVAYSAPAALAELVQRRAPAVLYLSAGLGAELPAIAGALDGRSVLTVAVSASYVPRRAVLGFDIEAGKPKLVVHLTQARRQGVAFRPELLRLARVLP